MTRFGEDVEKSGAINDDRELERSLAFRQPKHELTLLLVGAIAAAARAAAAEEAKLAHTGSHELAQPGNFACVAIERLVLLLRVGGHVARHVARVELVQALPRHLTLATDFDRFHPRSEELARFADVDRRLHLVARQDPQL